MASTRRPCGALTCRQILNIMVILGFMFNYMLRVNLTIAIIAMVVPTNSSQNTVTHNDSDCTKEYAAQTANLSRDQKLELPHLFHNEKGKEDSVVIKDNQPREQTRYPWNEFEQNLILGSFFWGYVFTELPGGRLAEVIGTKKVFGYCMLISSFITFITPAAASWGYISLVILRAILGLLLGATWPAIQPLTAHWIPPNERSKFVSNMMASSLGAAITMPISGYLIASFGWQSVFYVTGAVGLIWSLVWFMLIYDTPAQHPRISDDERHYIESSIGNTITKRKLAVPWRYMLTSAPVWAIVITHACSVFGYFTVVNQLPTYMKYILHFNIKENGLLSSLPYLGKYLFALATSILGDYLRQTNKLSVTHIRKYFTLFAVMSPGLLMVVQAYFGCDRTISVFIFTLALTINGAVSPGYLGNGLDIAPNFSGTIFGIANTFSSIGGYLSSVMVGTLTYNNQRYSSWSMIFWILAIIYCTGASVFFIFGTGEMQHWNDLEKRTPETSTKDEANEPLKKKDVPA